MRRRLLVLFNPHARAGGDRDVSDSFETKARAAGFDVRLHPTEKAGDAEELIAKHGAECDAVVIGGGDGSIRSALPAILKSELPLAVWPLGTANDFARSLDIENEDDCIAALASGNERRIDVAEINGNYFINNAAIGLPSEAAAQLTRDLKARLGPLATIALIPAILKSSKPFGIRIDADGRSERRTVLAILIGNGVYKGGFPIRYSGLADGKLHVVICAARSRWSLFAILIDVMMRRVERSPWIQTFFADAVSISTKAPKRISADGDVVSLTPANATLRPKAISVFHNAR